MNYPESGKEIAVNNPGTIRVTGKGLIRLKPDTTRITLTIEGVSPDYTILLRSSASDTARFGKALETVGFSHFRTKISRR